MILLGLSLVCWSIYKGVDRFPQPILSPLPPLINFSPVNRKTTSSLKRVLGFLPYWNFKYEPAIRYDVLTDVAIFGLTAGKDGSIKTKDDQGYKEAGWLAYNSTTCGTIIRKIHEKGGKAILVLEAFRNEDIESIMLSQNKQVKLIDQVLGIARQKNFNGINIDFEYVGDPGAETRNAFSKFIHLFREKSREDFELSVDVYADAAKTPRLWNLADIAGDLDQIIVMAYDFNRPSSDYSGPVAPLWEIQESVAAIAEIVPNKKILLGVPYYGYEWPTYSQSPISKTRAAGYLATYKRVKDLLNLPTSKSGWDERSFTPFIISTESGQTTQIFYDDQLSLSLKYDLVNDADLGGIAIWALGYEGESDELWNLLKDKFNK